MLRGRDLLTLMDYNHEEIKLIIDTARALKALYLCGGRIEPLKGKSVALYFELPSTRTRVSFEVAVSQLGGHPIFLRREELQLIRGETVADTARVLSRYVNAIVARVRSHETLIELAEYASVPVINALSDRFHPCQALADLMTIVEHKGRVAGLKVAFIGDGNNNVCHSLMIGCAKLGAEIWVACPKGYEPAEDVVRHAEAEARRYGGEVHLTNDPYEAARGADVIYTDVFISMGREEERVRRLRDFEGWQVNRALVSLAKEDYIFMHCLPAHRGEEVEAEVIDDPRHSVVWDQAENRLHVQRAVLALLL